LKLCLIARIFTEISPLGRSRHFWFREGGGKPRNEETATLAGNLAIEGAAPLRDNGDKIPLMRRRVKRAIRGTGTQPTT
jgi:hypothetical protein